MAKVRCKLLYNHSIGDTIELYGAMWRRDGEHHYATVDSDMAKQLVSQGNAEILSNEEVNPDG